MDKALIIFRMEIFILVSIDMVSHLELDDIFGRLEQCMKDNLKMDKKMEKEDGKRNQDLIIVGNKIQDKEFKNS